MSSARAEYTRPAVYVDDSAHRARRNDFDRIAPLYDRLAALTFGGAEQRAQTQLLPELRDARSALVLGGGTGWFLLSLLQQTRVERVLYIEKSENMLELSRAMLATRAPEELGRVEFRLGTEESLRADDGPFELVVTNFFLDQFNNHSCPQVIEQLASKLSAEGHWLFVDLHTPESGWQRIAAKALFKLIYSFFALTSHVEARRPPHYQATFDRLGLQVRREETFYATMIRARLLGRG